MKLKKLLTISFVLVSSLTPLYSVDNCSKWAMISLDQISIIIPACETAGSIIPAEDGEVPPIDSAVRDMYLDVINTARSESQDCGEYGEKPAVAPVTWSDALYKASYQHSNDLAQSDTFSHTGSGTETDVAAQALHPGEGSSVSERIEYAGYTNWKAYGENIAAGTVMDEAQEAIDAWLDSPGHCANLMSADFTEVGMAHIMNSDSHYTHYWAQDFGKR
jgi:uncharacterized protein YkwD